ncbi:MAG TPA: hypothetical protein VG245_02315 [Candidatus Dormibacteraeota bacterium]|jgi:hypothetical protein|nr:hypothetical protein [Candidatus Dormibacteraeota bacterium]
MKFTKIRTVALFATTGFAAVGMAAAPSSAAAANAAVLVGVAHLPSYPCSTGSLIAPGCGGATFAVNPASVGVTSVTISNYYEPCAPVAGSATGTITLAGTGTRSFLWVRVGLVAAVVIENGGTPSGAAVAAFVPLPQVPPGNCVTGSAALDAEVVAVGASL